MFGMKAVGLLQFKGDRLTVRRADFHHSDFIHSQPEVICELFCGLAGRLRIPEHGWRQLRISEHSWLPEHSWRQRFDLIRVRF